jgi:PKD repeat protein
MDEDQDGVRGGSEQTLEGIEVHLLTINDVQLASTTTGSNGLYAFQDLAPTGYRVEFVIPAVYSFTSQDTGSDDSLDSDVDPDTGWTGVVDISDSDADDVDAGLFSDLAPLVDAGASQTVVAGTNVSFSGTATDAGGLGTITSTAWDFDYDGVTFDSDTTGTLTPTHIYANPGTYLVALQATDASGNTGMDVTSVVVTAAGALIVSAGPDQSVTVGDSVSFSGSYSYTAGSVSSSGLAWDFDYDGVTFSADTTGTLTPTHTFTAEGTYQVALRVTADDGTYNLSVLEVQADYNYTGPSADAGSDQTIDQGDTVYFTGDYTAGDGTVDTSGLEWDFDYDGYQFEADTSDTTSPTWQYLASGSYTVAFRVTDENGLSSLDTMQVTVNNLAPDVSLSGGGTITVGDSASFTATVSDPGGSADPVRLYWDFDYDGSTFVPGGASGLTVTHTFVSPGDYTVAVLAVDSAGDSSLATVSVIVDDNQGVVIIDAGPDQAVNQGDAVDFDGSYSDPQSILTSTIEWDFDYDGTTFNAEPSASGTLTPTFTFSTPGLHLVALAIQDTSSDWHIGTLYVDVANLPPEVDPGADQTGEEGTAVDFDGTVTDPDGPNDLDQIDWDFNYDGMTFNAEPSASGVLTPSYTYASLTTGARKAVRQDRHPDRRDAGHQTRVPGFFCLATRIFLTAICRSSTIEVLRSVLACRLGNDGQDLRGIFVADRTDRRNSLNRGHAGNRTG